MTVIITNSFQFDWRKSRTGDILRCVKCDSLAFTVGELYKVVGSTLMDDAGFEFSNTDAEFVFVGNTVDGSVRPDIAKLMKGLRSSLHTGKMSNAQVSFNGQSPNKVQVKGNYKITRNGVGDYTIDVHDENDTHDIEVDCQIEQDDTPKQWEPDTIDPSIDIMKSIRDACRG